MQQVESSLPSILFYSRLCRYVVVHIGNISSLYVNVSLCPKCESKRGSGLTAQLAKSLGLINSLRLPWLYIFPREDVQWHIIEHKKLMQWRFLKPIM